jgi:hypothetical protein
MATSEEIWRLYTRRAFEIPDVVSDDNALAAITAWLVEETELQGIFSGGSRQVALVMLESVADMGFRHRLDPLLVPEGLRKVFELSQEDIYGEAAMLVSQRAESQNAPSAGRMLKIRDLAIATIDEITEYIRDNPRLDINPA